MTLITGLVFAWSLFIRWVQEPSEQGNFTHPYQDCQRDSSIEDDKREGAGPAVIPDERNENHADDEHVVHVVEQAVLAYGAQWFPVLNDIEHKQRYRDGAGKDDYLLWQVTPGVAVGTVHEVSATGIENENDG